MYRIKTLSVAGLALSLAMSTAAFAGQAQTKLQNQPPPSSDFPQGALSPDNLAKPRPKPPFNLTGLWMIDLSAGFSKFMFGPPYPKFKAAAQAAYEAAQAAAKEHKSFRDDIGQCYPAGMPMIMTRVWPIAMIQLPTAIYMISGFENEIRIIYIDGRAHTPPDIVVPSYDGDSVGHWEGDTLVVDTTSMISAHHWIDSGLPLSDEFHIIERMRLLNGGKTLEIKYIMTDPKNWEGEWTSTKDWQREDDMDITEVECTPDLNKHLLSTQDELK